MGKYGVLLGGGEKMSVAHRIPGLFLMVLCHVVVIYHLLERRHSKRKFALLSCLYAAGFVSMGAYMYMVSGITMLLTYLGVAVYLFLFFHIVSKECFPKKSFLFLTYFGLFSIIDNSLKLMVTLFLPHLSVLAEFYLVNVLRTAVLFLALALYKRYAAPVMLSLAEIRKGRWWNLALIALLFYLLQAAITVLYVGNAMSDIYLLFLFITISLVMCAVYAVVFSNISYMKRDAEAALIRQNAEYFSSRLSVLQDAEDKNRRLRHDMRHHINVIAAYAKTGDNAAILSYIGEYESEISEAAVKQYSVNRTVNSILSAYAGKAEENGIVFSVKCNVTRELGVREIDLIALLGNLLENALHGCQESGKENKSIEIHIRLQNKILIILCNNTCSEDLELADGLPVKKSIGISSILSVCRKYDGNLDYRIENETCSAYTVLNLQSCQ